MAFEFDAKTARPVGEFDPSTATEEKPASAMRKMGDLGLGFASGAVGATKALTDVAGAGNKASKILADLNTGINDYLSPEAKADQQEQSRIMSDAGGKGVWEGVKAGARAFGVAPVQTAVQGLGSVVPIIAGTALTGGAATAAAAGAGLGVAMGAGTAKGAIYDEIKKRGGTDAEATEAQAYGGANTDQIALGGALGAVDALTGVSKAASGVVRGALGKPVAQAATQAVERGIVSRAGMGVLGEIPLEAAQGGQEQVAANLAAQRAGYEAGTWDNVASNATLEALASAGPGAAFGAMGGRRGAPEAKDASAPPVAPPEPPARLLGNTSDPLIAFPDGTVGRQAEVDAYVAGLPEDQQAAARARLLGLGPQPATPLAPAVTEPAPPPSVQMGIDASAGVISKVAAQSVDTGVTQEIEFNQAAAEEQAAYDQAMAVQDEQAAAQDSVDKPVTSGAIAEAQMSEEDKRAVLFSNQAVADGGRQYVGTQDGDVLNGMGAPFTTRLAAARRANLEGKDWTIAPVFDGWVARRKDAIDGASSGVSPAAAGRSESGGDQPAPGVGSGVAADDGVETDTSGRADDVVGEPLQSSGGVDAEAVNAEANTPLAHADIAQAATETIADVQNPTPAANDAQAEPAPVETGAPVASAAAPAEGLPGAGSAPVEPVGVKQVTQPVSKAAGQRLAPAQAQKLQEAHKAHGPDVTLATVQRMYDRVMKSLITGKGSNGGTQYDIKPKARKELQAQADRLINDLSLFGVQQEQSAAVANSGTTQAASAASATSPTLDRIAAGNAWFSNPMKAADFITKNGLKETHKSVRTGPKRWDVQAKESEANAPLAPADIAQAATNSVATTEGNQDGTQADQTIQATPQRQEAPAEPVKRTLKDVQARRAAEKTGEFVSAPDGSIDYGEITPEMSKAMRRQAGKIRLRRGNDAWGLIHIEARHGEQFKSLGFQSANDYIAHVASSFNAVYKGSGAGLSIVLETERTGGRLMVQLEPSPDGDFYDVKSASPIRAGQYKNEEPLWQRAGTSAPTAQGSSLLPRDQNGNESVVLTGQKVKGGGALLEGRAQPSLPAASEQAPFAESPKNADKATTIPSGQSEASVPKAAPKVKAPNRIKQAAIDREKARADYFTPGNVVKSYGGHDEVLAYNAPTSLGGSWSVTVHAIGPRDGKWVRLGKPQDARTHSTQPDARELAAGPVVRLQYQPAAEVVYSEPRADGKPFPNAVERGVAPVVDQPVAPVESAQAATETVAKEATDVAKNATPESKSESTGKIEDFGQKIGGAKKDLWTGFKDDLSAVKDDEIAGRKLSEIWPAPDYQKLVDDGMDAHSVAIIRSLRDEIPAKPRNAYKLSRWADQVKTMRDLAANILNDKDTGESVTAQLARGTSQMQGIAGRAALYRAVGHGKSLEGIRLAHHHYSLYRGRENVELWVVERDAGATAFSNWPQELATGDTIQDAIAAFKARYAELDSVAAVKKASFDIITETGKKGFFIGKKIGRNIATLAGPFDSLKEARDYRTNNLDALNEKLAKYKEIPKDRRDTNEPRVGEDMRNGQDVTPEMFAEAFGFKGVEFGNWVEQKRRQKDLNDAYDALMDMAAIMGVPAKAISLNGELGLAFGARGSGGVNPAAAHYESDKIVINLTKREGAGSLGHEWWHAVDNYFSRMRSGQTSPFMTTATDVGLSARGSQYVAYPGVRKEMIDAFGEVVRSIRATAMKARSSKMDAKRTKEYWTTGEEMAARAFESYLISKLHDQNASNDYLANVVDEKTWEAMAALGMENDGSYPYPTAGEMPVIRAGFDKFFQTIQTKETDKGVALYSHGYPGTPTTVENLRAAIKDMTGVTGLNKLGRVVATTAADIKTTWEPLLGKKVNLASEGDAGMAQAFYDPKSKTVFLVSDRIREGTEAAVLAHELMHKHGVPVLGKEGWDRLHDVIGTWANADKESPEYAVWRYASNKVAAVGEKLSNQELFPYAVEAAFKMGIKPDAEASRGTVARWLDTVVQSLKAVWAKVTNRPETFDAQDLVNLAFGIAQMENPDSAAAVRRFQDAPTADEEIQYSRTLADKGAASGMGSIANKAVDVLSERLSHAGTIGIWHKTFGSMYNLAESSKPFKRVFDTAQDFINDVSFYASEASDQAPKLLPRLEDWRDVAKTPISPTDNRAIESPIFEGTLTWARDEAGKPIKLDDLAEQAKTLTVEQKAQRLLRGDHVTAPVLKMWQGKKVDEYEKLIEAKYERDIVKAGVVWTDSELGSMFNLTKEQIALYREFRGAIDTSLDNMAKSEMLRYAGKDAAALKDMVMDAPDVDTAALLLRDHLLGLSEDDPARSDSLIESANGVMDRADKVTKLKAEGYAPLSRFGQYSVDVVVDGERQYFGLFETKHAANQMAAKMRAEYGVANVSSGTMSNKEFQLFQGITPESLELFGNMLGMDSEGDKASDKAFQDYLRLTKNNRSAMKRMIHRKGITGFSTDTGRVLAAFIYSNARQTSAALHMGGLDSAVQEIPKGQGQLKDAAIELRDYIKNPREEAQAMRGLLFAQYLGGNIASMMMNFMQVPTVSLPYLTQFGGMGKATSALLQAMKDQKSMRLEPGLKQALERADEKGITQPQAVHELMAQSRGAATLKSGDGTRTGNALAGAGNYLSKLSMGWGKLFGMAEQINRRSTFIAAYRLAVEQGRADPGAFAEKAVNETQFISNKANKAKFARGAIGGTLMTFKSYSTNYLELLYRLSTKNGPEGKKAALLMMGMLFLMAGAGGLPGAEDADDLIDGIAQRMGYNLSTKKAKEKFLEDLFGRAMAQFLMSGVSGIPGSPIDVSGRMGMGNLIPGTGVFLPKANHASDLWEFGGPAAGLAKRFGDAAGQFFDGDVFEAAMSASPIAVANARKGVDMMSTGMYKDAKGYKVMDTTPAEGLMKIAGFQPRSVKDDSDDSYLRLRTKNFYNEYKQDVAARWANGLFESDPDQVQEAKDMIASWNEKNPELPMRANMPAIGLRLKKMRETREERILKGAPKAMQTTIRREIADERAAQ